MHFLKVHTRADSNRRSRLRRAVLYPLSYGCIKRLYEIALVILTHFFYKVKEMMNTNLTFPLLFYTGIRNMSIPLVSCRNNRHGPRALPPLLPVFH